MCSLEVCLTKRDSGSPRSSMTIWQQAKSDHASMSFMAWPSPRCEWASRRVEDGPRSEGGMSPRSSKTPCTYRQISRMSHTRIRVLMRSSEVCTQVQHRVMLP
jgi:hypothetical protein